MVLPITIQITVPIVPILHQGLIENKGLLPGDRLAQDQVPYLTQANQTPLPAGISTICLAAAQIASVNTL